MTELVPLTKVDADAVERLLDRAFGPDRRARTAYRVREGTAPVAALSFAALDGGALVGTIQCWPVRLTADDGARVAMVMVGPVAVDPARQQEGIGRLLTARALAAAAGTGDDRALMLIGDPEYYGRFFGFSADRTDGWRAPGPVERHRLLARGEAVPAMSGVLGPESRHRPNTPFTCPPPRLTCAAMPMPPQPDLSTLSLAQIAQLAEEDKLPPVERWNPTHCGDSEMRIARDGAWFHQGSPITRPAMVRAFSRILRREPDGGYVLVTPVEKLDIAVEDAPFVAVEMKAEGEGEASRLAFRLNTGDLVTAGPDHPLRFAATEEGPRPYLLVRGGLEALVARPVYYELAERAMADGEPAGVWSDGAFFALESAA